MTSIAIGQIMTALIGVVAGFWYGEPGDELHDRSFNEKKDFPNLQIYIFKHPVDEEVKGNVFIWTEKKKKWKKERMKKRKKAKKKIK